MRLGGDVWLVIVLSWPVW